MHCHRNYKAVDKMSDVTGRWFLEFRGQTMKQAWEGLKKFIGKILSLIPTRWSGIRRIQEIKLISSMYIWIFMVPIAAKVLSRVEEIVTVRIFDYQFEVFLTLPFSWNVFYFSAIFFALATLLHRLTGPRLILDHPTYASFREEGKEGQLSP
jgi:hypothetical protein